MEHRYNVENATSYWQHLLDVNITKLHKRYVERLIWTIHGRIVAFPHLCLVINNDMTFFFHAGLIFWHQIQVIVFLSYSKVLDEQLQVGDWEPETFQKGLLFKALDFLNIFKIATCQMWFNKPLPQKSRRKISN